MPLSTWLISTFRPGYEADLAAYILGITLALLFLAYKTYYWHTVPKKERRHYVIHTFSILGFIVIFTFLLYSAYYYWYSNVATEGVTVCVGDECKWAAHMHAYVDELTICGKPARLSFEEGSLDNAHTHKDGRIHWHDILTIDKNTKQILDTSSLTLGAFFDEISWKFNENCLKDICECDGKLAMLTVLVNEKQVQNPAEYVWKDGDKLRIALK